MQNTSRICSVVWAFRAAAVLVLLGIFAYTVLAQTPAPLRAQTTSLLFASADKNSPRASGAVTSDPGPLLFGKGFLRGYMDFEFAPPHNEPDLGRCNLPQQPCSAFARYMAGGYVEFQPFARTPLRHAYFFFEPRFFFGNNIPQISYTYSMRPLAWERTMGLAVALPKHFELRITNHGVTSFSPFDKSLGTFDYGPNKEPLGIYNTIGVRWYFGGYDHSSSTWD